MKKNIKIMFLFSIIILILSVVICSCIGAANISMIDSFKIIFYKIFRFNGKLQDIKSSYVTIVWNVRLPRIIVSLFVGSALSIAGVTYQGLFKNPMADPYVIGVSSGAAFGAALGIASHIAFSFLGLSMTSLCAFVGAIGVMFLVYSISRVGRKVPITTLLLSGIAVGNFLTAFTSLIMIFAGDDLNKIYFWTMGSFSGKNWSHVSLIVPYVLIGFGILKWLAKDLNLIFLGEDTAGNLGVNVEKIKLILLITSTLVTAIAVSISGIIGFVGLIIPHITRIIVGPDNKKLYPFAFIFGGLLMVICDTIARTIIAQEIPVGLVTSVLGGPFFVYLLRIRKREIL